MMMGWVSGAIALVSVGAVAEAKSAFSTDEAARCAASFAYTLDAMQAAPSIPQEVRRRMRDGLAIWEYELSASAPGASGDTLQAAANRAVAVIRAGMPDGDAPDVAAQRGDYLTGLTTDCAAKIKTAYGDAEHPVIPFLREADAQQTAPPAPLPPLAPGQAAGTEDDPKGRGLR